MLEPDREPDQGGRYADLATGVLGQSGMHGGRRMASERLRPAEADGELDYFEPIEEGEGLGLSSLDLKREGRAGRARLPLHERPRPIARREQRRIVDPRDLRVPGEEFRDLAGIGGSALDAQRQGLERAAQHPAGMRIKLRADGAAQGADRIEVKV